MSKYKKHLSKKIVIPDIPKSFLDHDRAKSVLCHTLNEFDDDEQAVIFYYCYLNLSIDEISELIDLSPAHVKSVLIIYAEKLTFKLDVFMKCLPYNSEDLLPVGAILGCYE